MDVRINERQSVFTTLLLGFPEEQSFIRNAELGVYDGWKTGRLLSGESKVSDGAGVLVPLTPTIALDCVLLACWPPHKHPQFSVHCPW